MQTDGINQRRRQEEIKLEIAIIAHDTKKELMAQFCIAYCGILSKHNLCATAATARYISEATGLHIDRLMSGDQGGEEQVASRVAYDEIDVETWVCESRGLGFQRCFRILRGDTVAAEAFSLCLSIIKSRTSRRVIFEKSPSNPQASRAQRAKSRTASP